MNESEKEKLKELNDQISQTQDRLHQLRNEKTALLDGIAVRNAKLKVGDRIIISKRTRKEKYRIVKIKSSYFDTIMYVGIRIRNDGTDGAARELYPHEVERAELITSSS